MKCFSTIAGAEHVGRNRHRDAVLMVGEPDDQVGESLPVGWMTLRFSSSADAGYAGGALEEAELTD